MVCGKSLSEKLALDELKKMGFSNPSQEEITLYRLIGVKDFRAVLNTAFEYVCLEYEHLSKPKKGNEFIEFCKHRRADFIEQSIERLKEISDQNFHFEPPTREYMIEMIAEQYGKSKG